MRIRLWEAVIGLLGMLLAGLFLFAHSYPLGLFVLGVTAVWLGSRLRVAEPGHVAGVFAIRRGYLELARCALLALIYMGICATLFIGQIDHWYKATPGQVAIYALAGFSFLLLQELKRGGDTAMNWLNGGFTEETVGKTLEPLKAEGWTVIHNLLRDDGWGNIDHVAWGSGGTYAIETKSGKLRRGDLRQAAGNAAWLKGKLDVRWVTAVVCVQDIIEPYEDGVVWVVSRDRLVDWLRERPARRGLTPSLVPTLV